MLKIVQSSLGLPASFICDPSATFQPGQVAELTVIGNTVMATVSNGTAPLGIIDDIRTTTFSNVSWNEAIVVPAVGVSVAGKLVTPIDIKAELKHASIVKNSFNSTVDVTLNLVNGVITFLAGTELNYDLLGTGSPNAIRTIVNYTYFVPNILGDDSTSGSGRITIIYDRCFIQVSTFETNVQYPVRAPLFVSETGMFTSRRPSSYHPSVGMVTAPPSPLVPTLELLWY